MRCAAISTPAAARSSPTRPAAARPSTPRSGGLWPSCFPTNPLVPIPQGRRALHASRSAPTLSKVQYTKAAGGGADFPQLEGVRINDHWAIIYSKYDIGCALERHTGIECKGYTYESALKIAGNIVIYSTLP